MDEKTLEKMAVEELLREAQRGKERSNTMGPSGWQKNLIPTANKRFLQRTVASTINSHHNKMGFRKRRIEEQDRDQSDKQCTSNDGEARDIKEKSKHFREKKQLPKQKNKIKMISNIRVKPYDERNRQGHLMNQSEKCEIEKDADFKFK